MKKIFSIILIFICTTLNVSANNDTLRVNLLIQEAIRFETESEFDSTFKLANEALTIAEELDYQKGIASAYMRIGSIHNRKGKNDSALIYIQKAYEIRKERQDYSGATKCCFSLCNIYNQTGKIDMAFQVLYEALRLNKLSKNKFDLAEIYIELGHLNTDYGTTKASLIYYQEAEKLAIVNEDFKNLLNAYSGLGNYYFNNNNYKQALSYYLKSSEINSKINNRVALTINYNNIALCYDELNDTKNANKFYHKALDESIALGLRNEESMVNFNLANMFNKKKMPDSSIYYLNQSLSIAKETNDSKRIADSYESLSDAYTIKNDFKRALDYHKLAFVLKDSLINSEKITRIAEMQTIYETEKKEQQINLLNEQNRNKDIQRNAFIAGFTALLLFTFVLSKQRNKIKKEKNRSEKLLLNILPSDVAEELKSTGESEAKLYNNVTVLFTDFANFTGISQQMTAAELVKEIHRIFTAFDAIIEINGLEKIKTIGDAYLAVCGLPNEDPLHAQKVVNASIDIIDWINNNDSKFQIRIGINSGSVVAGIVGVKKYAYDIWGDTVNTAARIESSGEVGKINISETTYNLVKDEFKCIHRGKIKAKGKGEVDMYFIDIN